MARPALSPSDTEQLFPDAVRIARRFREVFGAGVRLVHARQGEHELGHELTGVDERAAWRELYLELTR